MHVRTVLIRGDCTTLFHNNDHVSRQPLPNAWVEGLQRWWQPRLLGPYLKHSKPQHADTTISVNDYPVPADKPDMLLFLAT